MATTFAKNQFRLYLNTDNDAFAEGNANAEIARILRELADYAEEGTLTDIIGVNLRDSNGNVVGRAFTQEA